MNTNERISHLKRPPLRRGGECSFTQSKSTLGEFADFGNFRCTEQNGWLVVIPLLSFDFCVFVHRHTHTHTHTHTLHTHIERTHENKLESWRFGFVRGYCSLTHSFSYSTYMHSFIWSAFSIQNICQLISDSALFSSLKQAN
jgi:hypothetical protein